MIISFICAFIGVFCLFEIRTQYKQTKTVNFNLIALVVVAICILVLQEVN